MKDRDFHFLTVAQISFFVGARVWACKWKAEFSGSDSHRHGAEEADWEFIFWSQHPCASQPGRYAARHSHPTRSERKRLYCSCFSFSTSVKKVKFMLGKKKKIGLKKFEELLFSGLQRRLSLSWVLLKTRRLQSKITRNCQSRKWVFFLFPFIVSSIISCFKSSHHIVLRRHFCQT